MPRITNYTHEFYDKCTECDYEFKVKNEKLAQRLISRHMLKKHKIKLGIKQLETRYNLEKIDNCVVRI